jgi:cellulose synthase/poly-beta-1,6-N-acetylglucosamine synthase-like glycosyltransferase
MLDLPNLIVCAFLFVSLFFEVFLLLTFLENRPEMKKKRLDTGVDLPTATIIVPCFNEEESIFGTVESLLALDYPKDKLKIMIIDDGSTDNSWNLIQRYRNNKQIELHKKENGGKHTALNYAISKSTSDIIGCLDADSFVNPEALKNIVSYFSDKETMAVTPAIKIYEPDNILRKIQKVEYDWGIFLRKMLSFLDAMYVTPGPFSFFRREVFTNLGLYKKAHNTEDMEMAMRMQKHGYKIKNCHTAFVYTIAPHKFSKLFTQRLRWTYGFFKNAIDYQDLFFNKKQGNLGFLVLPIMFISAFSTLWLSSSFVYHIVVKVSTWFTNWQAINFNIRALDITKFNFEWFYFNTSITTFIAVIGFSLMIFFVLAGRKISDGKIKLIKMELLYFFVFYPFMAPTWLAKSFYNILTAKKTNWR